MAQDPAQRPNARIGDDLIVGVRAIANELDETPRRIHHLLSTRQLPGFKLGGRWYCCRSRLAEFFLELEQKHADPKLAQHPTVRNDPAA